MSGSTSEGLSSGTAWRILPRSRARQTVAGELRKRKLPVQAGKDKFLETRRQVQQGWTAIHEILVEEGQPELAAQVRRFAERMSPLRTQEKWIAATLLQHSRDAFVRDEYLIR